MTTKLNSFLLPDNVILEMKRRMKYSKRKDIEVAFNLCAENGNLHDEYPCCGTKCNVGTISKCDRGKFVGDFHTHVDGTSEPSLIDLAGAYYHGIMCIGNAKKKDIKCYIRKDKSPKIKELEDIVPAETIYPSSFISEKEMVNRIKLRDALKKHFFNIVEII